jgi:hypothetical protein
MSDAALDQEKPGFAFTDEDYTRRYSPDTSPRAAPSTTTPRAPSRTGRVHGGGNSFMRARRRRLAAASAGQ